MSFFDRMSTGWEIAVSSMKVLRANKQLIIFPILSGIMLILISAGFVLPIVTGTTNIDTDAEVNVSSYYLLLFAYYVVVYFVIVFFNMALIHCTRLFFEGKEVSIAQGLRFSLSRAGVIFSWALLSATVGLVLKIIQENTGWLGKIFTSFVGFVWGIGTFFAVPVIAYEKLGPIDAAKRSAAIMREKWGERLGAGFSFAAIGIIAFIVVAICGMAVSALINEQAGILIFATGVIPIAIITSTLNSIFVSAVYHNINGNIDQHFSTQLLDNLFVKE